MANANDVHASFLAFLLRLSNNRLVACEHHGVLASMFNRWLGTLSPALQALRGTNHSMFRMMRIVNALVAAGKIYVHRVHETDYYIVVKSEAWKEARIVALDGVRPPAAPPISTVTPDMLRSKGGIEISEIRHQSVRIGESFEALFRVSNTGNDARRLQKVLCIGSSFSLVPLHIPAVMVPSGGSVEVRIRFNPGATTGRHDGLFSFHFSGFFICRKTTATCTGSVELQESLRPTAPYVRPQPRRNGRGRDIDGVRPDGGGGLPRYLKGYEMPAAIKEMRADMLQALCVSLGADFEEALPAVHQTNAVMEDIVIAKTIHEELWKHLLYLEENALEVNQSSYDMSAVRMTQQGPYLILNVPGLAECRPSVLKGDSVRVHVGGSSPAYIGYVHNILERQVQLKFCPTLHLRHTAETRYDVEFVLPRRTLRGQHQAISLLTPYNIITLYPTAPPEVPRLLQQETQFRNRRLNEIQRLTVNRILKLDASQQLNKPPYVIFGPPGTGKSTTVVETIFQLLARLPAGERILVCASSNAATDLLVTKLSSVLSPQEMFRAMAYQRAGGNTVPDDIRRYCCYDGEGYIIPPAPQLHQYRVVVATTAMAGKLYNADIDRHSFRTVIVDEAGHPEEPSIYQAIAWLLNPKGLLILAGDPMQLGPVTYSDSAMSVSILERLLKDGIYARNIEQFPQSNGYNPDCLTKLLYSYRCHPAILKVPNELFYNSELIEMEWNHQFLLWDQLPAPKFPMIFHGVNGTHTREANSPSWFNVDEIEVLSSYLEKILMSFPRASVGIIAPYQKQVSKIRMMMNINAALSRADTSNVKVGSCEQFQGSECDVIIITTVRSTTGLAAIGDTSFNLGFVSNPKRLNVAVTRAKGLLIVIGNPDVLSNDSNWKALLTHCRNNNSFIGYGGFEPVDAATNEETRRWCSIQ